MIKALTKQDLSKNCNLQVDKNATLIYSEIQERRKWMIKYNSIDEAIDEAGLKQEFIAKKMGISRQRLYDLRKNPTLLNIEQMELLANILNLKFSDIYDIRKKFKK